MNRSNPLVRMEPGIRAYAGVPLIGCDGLPLGALCVLDGRPRGFSALQLGMLAGLADQAMALLELRRHELAGGVRSEAVLAEAREPGRLRRALDDGELVPHYQPVVDLRTGRTTGLEALLRWEHPEHGRLSPATFLPAVEAGALVVPVGRAVLDGALRQVALLRGLGLHLPGGMAVNVASGQLARPGLARTVLDALHHHGVPGSALALEITEATALPDTALARAELGVLADAGVRIVVDDYGVGWSNLSRVLDLPASGLKLDRSIAAAVLSDRRARAMAESTARLAADLGLHLVAEGVETEQVRRALVDAGYPSGQGWLFSPAVEAAALPRLLTVGAAGAAGAA